MPLDSLAVQLGKDRVVRMFGESTVERIDRVRELPHPSNDVLRKREEAARQDDIRRRLDAVMERSLLEPISSIATIAGVLRHQSSGAQADQLGAIAEAAARADAMLRDVLNFVRTGTGGLNVSRRKLDLKVLCERVVDAVHAAHPDRPAIFTSDRRVEGQWDPEAMELLLSKLLLNAIQHAPPRPAIRVSVQSLADSAIVEVWSAGTIASDVMRNLFEPFISTSFDSPRHPRLGLGLYLAREVARAHGGRIEVRNGEGTTFRVTLPKA